MSPVSESAAARKAFEAYREFMDGGRLNVAGVPYRWEDMPTRVQHAFHAAAHAGAMHYANRGLGRVGQRSEHEGFEGTYIACTACGGHGLLILGEDGDEMRSPVAVAYGRSQSAQKGKTMLQGKKLELAGMAAYEAYRMGVDGVAVNGDELPHWPGLKESIRVAWRMAADAAVMMANSPTPPLPSRWQPLAPGVQVSDQGLEEAGFSPSTLLPVDTATAAQAQESMPVGAEDDEPAVNPFES